MPAESFDAVLLVSFGGPEAPEEVAPFLARVTGGRGVPPERLAEVAGHYAEVGGVSPLNAQNRALLAALRTEFDQAGLRLPLYWGNRNWTPFLADTLAQMAADGVRRALAFLTSAYSSYSSCRQYQEDIAAGLASLSGPRPQVEVLRRFYNHPGFLQPLADELRAGLARLPAELAADAHLVFVAHSIPAGMATNCAYAAQLAEVARLVSGLAGAQSQPRHLAYSSRSGPPAVPWLAPDPGDLLEELAAGGARAAVLVPAGFVSDHMEVRYDLDVQAVPRGLAAGLAVTRVATPGADPRFVAMVRELVEERLRPGQVPRRALGRRGPAHDSCPPGCCPPPPPPARGR